jgi:hypothetical protein
MLVDFLYFSINALNFGLKLEEISEEIEEEFELIDSFSSKKPENISAIFNLSERLEFGS